MHAERTSGERGLSAEGLLRQRAPPREEGEPRTERVGVAPLGVHISLEGATRLIPRPRWQIGEIEPLERVALVDRHRLLLCTGVLERHRGAARLLRFELLEEPFALGGASVALPLLGGALE